eukprot:GEMP01002840.1.p1 GENE.GEMP01002840.1~~GEMP01002840.1.p1  ORF type:complete len:882 (+),score=189.77 GEMP01002840.1:495-3140(+)
MNRTPNAPADTVEETADNDADGTSEPFSEPCTQPIEKLPTEADEVSTLDVSSGESEVARIKTPPEGDAAVGKEWINYAAAGRMSIFVWRPESKFGLRVNPRVFIASTLITWVFVIVCCNLPRESYTFLTQAKISVTDYFTWLYIFTQDAWMVFIIVLYVSKYGAIKLGDKDEEPEYSTITWFTMLFSCGVSVGLFFFGVAEPMTHYTAQVGTDASNRYSHLSADDRAQWALEVVFYHWGMHGWVVYTLIAITMGFMGYRKKLPVTMRSCFYPLLGDKVFGVIGDCIDTMSAVCTMFGICTSLGLGVIDLVAGLKRLSGCTGYMDRESCMQDAGTCFWANMGRCIARCDQYAREKLITMSSIDDAMGACTADATCSWDAAAETCLANEPMGFKDTVGSQMGLVAGITFLATISVLTGVKCGIKLFSIFCFSMGMFLWTYVFLSDDPLFFLDAFVQQIGMYFNYILQIGFHTDAYARHLVSSTKETEGASPEWMHNWTMFFWGWWIAWSPYVGMFIAKISRGRTIRQIINGTMTAPALYCFLWFTVFGGSGLKMERMAAAAGVGSVGLKGAQSPTYLTINRTTGNFDTLDPCERGDDNCMYASRLSQRNREDQWMDMISQFYSLAPLMMGISLMAIVLYFVTSADSGSLIIDCLCSNGMENPPIPQKIYWAVMNGFVASTLLYVGSTVAGDSKHSLDALQSAGICSGLPYTIIICFMCASIWKACAYDMGDLEWRKDRFFKTDLFDVFDVHWTKEWGHKFRRTCFAAVAPWYFLRSSLPHTTMKNSNTRILYLVMVAALFHAWLIFMCLESAFGGAMVIGWWWYFCFGTVLSFFRGQMRTLKNLEGDFFQDWFSSMMLYPIVCEQLDAHFSEEPAPAADKYEQ